MPDRQARSAAQGHPAFPPFTETGNLYRLGCGCRARLIYGVLASLSWKVVHRCNRHPRDPVPVRSMRLV